MTDKQSAAPAAVREPPPTPATRAYMDAAMQMHLDMAVRFSGDADKDFAAVMTAHRKASVELARIELQHGADPDMKRLAEQIIAASEREIALMGAWQAKHR